MPSPSPIGVLSPIQRSSPAAPGTVIFLPKLSREVETGREWPGDQGPSALAGEKGGEEGPCGGATWLHIWGVFGTLRGFRKPGVLFQKKNSLPVGREGETGSSD